MADFNEYEHWLFDNNNWLNISIFILSNWGVKKSPLIYMQSLHIYYADHFFKHFCLPLWIL